MLCSSIGTPYVLLALHVIFWGIMTVNGSIPFKTWSRFRVDLAWLVQNVPLRFMYLWAMIALLLFTGWLGMRGLSANALWYDEIWSLIYSGGQQYGSKTSIDVVNTVVAQLRHEKNPPGYYVLLHYWGTAVGWSDAADRYLSLLAGMLTVAFTYRLGYAFSARLRQQSRFRIALASAFTVGTSAYFVFYLYEMRVYTLVTALGALTLWTYWRLIHLRRSPSLLLQAAFIFSLTALLYSHYQAVLLLVLLAGYHFLFVLKHKRWFQVASLIAVGGMLFAPWAFILWYYQSQRDINPIARTSLDPLSSLIFTFSNTSNALFILLLCAAAYYWLWKERVRGIWFFALGGVAAALAVDRFFPFINNVRYIIFLWPILAVLFGFVTEYLVRLKFPVALLAVIWIITSFGSQADPAFQFYVHGRVLPWREFRSALEERIMPNDFVAFHSGDFDWVQELELDHYMNGLPVNYKLMERIPGTSDTDDYDNQVRNLIAPFDRVWVGVSHLYPPNFRLAYFDRALTTEGFSECDTAFDLPAMTLYLYARLPQTLDDTSLRFGDGVGLKLLEPVRVLPGGKIGVLAGWFKGQSVPDETYSVAFHVDDDTGKLVAQTDYGLSDSQSSCQMSSLLLSPGHYSVLAVVYDWHTNIRLPGLNTATGEQADRLKVSDVEVQ
jgi:hypothetical protein